MNTQHRILSIAMFILAAPFCAAADVQLPTIQTGVSAVVVSCKNERLPTQRAVAGLLDSNNAAYVYAQRDHLMQIARRECMRGVPYVAFVRDVATNSSTLAQTTARAPIGLRVLGMVRP